MPGNFEDHDTTETEKSSKYYMGKEQRNSAYIMPSIKKKTRPFNENKINITHTDLPDEMTTTHYRSLILHTGHI